MSGSSVVFNYCGRSLMEKLDSILALHAAGYVVQEVTIARSDRKEAILGQIGVALGWQSGWADNLDALWDVMRDVDELDAPGLIVWITGARDWFEADLRTAGQVCEMFMRRDRELGSAGGRFRLLRLVLDI
jgi:RNAse (barnase) inhibitor barstar